MVGLVSHGRIIDSHGHLTDPRWGPSDELDGVISQALTKGLAFFMQGGVDPQEWERQIALANRYPGRIGLCFGLHPYTVARSSETECDAALDRLAKAALQARAIGEMGLDLRQEFEASRELQIDIFVQQLEMAQMLGKPIVCHIVRAHAEALRVFDLYGVPDQRGMIHSFNGPWEKAKDFLDLGLALSVGGPLCRPRGEALRSAVQKMPRDRLLIESDCPDQAPNPNTLLNPPESVLQVAETVANLWNTDVENVLSLTASNFEALFGKVDS